VDGHIQDSGSNLTSNNGVIDHCQFGICGAVAGTVPESIRMDNIKLIDLHEYQTSTTTTTTTTTTSTTTTV
jgi:hypothetical protein